MRDKPICLYPGGYTIVRRVREGGALVSAKTKQGIAKKSQTLEGHEVESATVNRLKRAHGQLGAVVRMLEEGRDCEEVVQQIAAVNKAINTAAFTLISSNLKECMMSNKSESKEIADKLQKLFLSLA